MENGSSNKALKPMDSEQLREYGHRMVNFIADYYKTIETFPVLSQVQPGYLHNLLPDSAPEQPETLEQVLDDVKEKILPGVTHWQSPSFFAYYPANSSVAGFLGEMLSAALNIVGFSWVSSPAATELEMIVLDWFAKLLNLPEQFLSRGNGGGVIQGTASEAILVVMIAARDKVLRSLGKKALEKLVVYSSDQTHSSLQKACQLAGIHLENCRVLKTDSSTNYALRPESLQEAVSKDLEAGLIPFFLCGTVGTTSSTAVDPLAALGKMAKSNEMWFHVDAAYAGSACICPEYRQYIDGVETADSFNMNAHKWFLTNFDCSLLWVKDRYALTEALSTNPEFLKNKASQANLVVDYKDWQIPLGRRFRSLKLWMVLRLYGAETLKSYIRNHIKLAKDLQQLVSQDPNFEVVTPRIFSLVCFRIAAVDNDDEKTCNNLNRSLLDAVNSSGKLFISHTSLSGKFVLRLAIGAPLTEEKHVMDAWKVIQEEASFLLASQAVSRRLIQRPLAGGASIYSSSSLRSLHGVSDHLSGNDNRRYSSSLATKGVGHLARKGTGGRSSVSGIVATVFGATGFLGRYLVQQLAKMGSQVLVPFRGSEDNPRHLKLMGDLGQVVPMKFDPRDEDSIKAVMAKANVVINLIGREYETRNFSFQEVNHHMAEKLALVAKEHGGIMRFIQVSCLGASVSSPSRMQRAKAAAEEAVLSALPEATVMRPATMIGTEDRILNPWAMFVKKYGFLPLIGGGTNKFQPVYVVDVAAAIVAALKDDGSSMGKTYELGGPDVFTPHDLAEIMFDMIREWPRYVKLPFPIAKAMAGPRDFMVNKVSFPLPSPQIFNFDQINTLTTDTLVSDKALTFQDLDLVPHKLKGYPVEFLIQYRKGGPNFGSTVSEKIPTDFYN
uniref:NAD-dependent epimerase/dehydratase domain-containing protein n=1 Tax=Brassica oleracea var. oleracea TaxID=109376 RepID=A0A0D3D2A5_BRAOL